MKNKHSLGQNWLKDRSVLEEIAELAFEDVDLCVEIGPGLGTLTSSLLRRFKKVLAIELDESLAKNLPKSFPRKNLDVRNEDILKFDFSEINEPFVVAGNIPYYITSPIIEKLLALKKKPKRIVLLVQKEVAEKVAGKDGNSSLSLFVDNFAEAFLGPIVTKNFFTPPPKVDSRVLILIPREIPKTLPEEGVLEFVHKSFGNPRKKLSANLSTFVGISKAELEKLLEEKGIEKNARPADLSLDDYAMLAKTLKKR